MSHEERTVVVLSGGGTGGHLYPAIAIAEALVERRPDVRPFFLGAARGLEARVLPERGLEHLLLPIRGVDRGAGLANLAVLPALARSLTAVAGVFRRLRPELVVVTGGYAGAPAGIGALLRGVPLALQEQNSVPGVTTRLLAPFARQIHLAFPEAAERLPTGARARALQTGNPVRPPVPVDVAQARRTFGLAPRGPVVLVMGGSQGSAALNRVVLEAVREVQEGRLGRPGDLQLLWATGPSHLHAIRDALEEAGRPDWVHAIGYVDRVEQALAVATLAVSRAGAMATSEFLAWGLPSVLVPLPSAAADHQTMNARSLAEAGAAVHLREAGLRGEALWTEVLALASDPARLEARRKAALERARPGSARRIAAALDALLPPPAGGTAEGKRSAPEGGP